MFERTEEISVQAPTRCGMEIFFIIISIHVHIHLRNITSFKIQIYLRQLGNNTL